MEVAFIVVPQTKSIRILGSFELFPKHYIVHTFTSEHNTLNTNNKLIETLNI